MAVFEEFIIDSTTGKKLYAVKCIPEGTVRGIVQIAHGIGDHIDRYRPFMAYLAEHGLLALGNDHLGHGKNITGPEDQGFFCPKDGWRHVVRDMTVLHDMAASEYPGVPYILFGHSMGSFLARTYAADYTNKYDLLIISGTGHPDGPAVKGGSLLAKLIVKLRGYASNGAALEKLAMGNYNKRIQNPRTPFDWISADPEQVDKYAADPMCGFTAKAGVYSDMMQGILYITDKDTIARVSPEKPVYFMSGTDDPVGDYGKGVQKAYECFREAGIQDVKIRLYEGGRHEMLNELNRDQVFRDILDWINEHIGDGE